MWLSSAMFYSYCWIGAFCCCWFYFKFADNVSPCYLLLSVIISPHYSCFSNLWFSTKLVLCSTQTECFNFKLSWIVIRFILRFCCCKFSCCWVDSMQLLYVWYVVDSCTMIMSSNVVLSLHWFSYSSRLLHELILIMWYDITSSYLKLMLFHIWLYFWFYWTWDIQG